MLGKRPVPFPEFDRARWPDRHKPQKTTDVVLPMPEPRQPSDFGRSLQDFRDSIARWDDEKLHGELAQLAGNITNGTCGPNYLQAIREAEIERAEGLHNHRVEYARRNKLFLDDPVAIAAKRKAHEEHSDSVTVKVPLGKGAAHTFTVPRVKVENAALRASSESIAR